MQASVSLVGLILAIAAIAICNHYNRPELGVVVCVVAIGCSFAAGIISAIVARFKKR